MKANMNNTNYLKKKDVTVIIVNLLVLSIVVYIYYIVVNLKTLLSNENVCILKTCSKTEPTDYINDLYSNDSKMASQNSNIRHIRSTNSIKCNFMILYVY